MEPFRRFCRLLLIIVFLILEDWMTSAELILHPRLICLSHNFVLIHILCSSFVFLSPLRRKVPLIIWLTLQVLLLVVVSRFTFLNCACVQRWQSVGGCVRNVVLRVAREETHGLVRKYFSLRFGSHGQKCTVVRVLSSSLVYCSLVAVWKNLLSCWSKLCIT